LARFKKLSDRREPAGVALFFIHKQNKAVIISNYQMSLKDKYQSGLISEANGPIHEQESCSC